MARTSNSSSRFSADWPSLLSLRNRPEIVPGRDSGRVIAATIPGGPRRQPVGGTWDSTAVLREAGAALEATAATLPHVAGY